MIEVVYGADLFICSPVLFIGDIVQEITGIPWLTAAVTPAHFVQYKKKKNKDYHKSQNTPPDWSTSGLKKYEKLIRDFRNELHLPELPFKDYQKVRMAKHIILGVSPNFFKHCRKKYPHTTVTGFWFYEDTEWKNWLPDITLQNFMDKTPKPLVLTYSSLPVKNPEKILRIHIEAALRIQYPLLIQKGWAGFDKNMISELKNNTNIMFTKDIAHDWLFSKASAVIHHGGIGTTARAIKCGCPMLVEPYGNDQYFNARRAIELEIGAAVHPHKLNAASLAWILKEKVLSDKIKANISKLSKKINKENGINNACNYIEKFLKY